MKEQNKLFNFLYIKKKGTKNEHPFFHLMRMQGRRKTSCRRISLSLLYRQRRNNKKACVCIRFHNNHQVQIIPGKPQNAWRSGAFFVFIYTWITPFSFHHILFTLLNASPVERFHSLTIGREDAYLFDGKERENYLELPAYCVRLHTRWLAVISNYRISIIILVRGDAERETDCRSRSHTAAARRARK